MAQFEPIPQSKFTIGQMVRAKVDRDRTIVGRICGIEYSSRDAALVMQHEMGWSYTIERAAFESWEIHVIALEGHIAPLPNQTGIALIEETPLTPVEREWAETARSVLTRLNQDTLSDSWLSGAIGVIDELLKV